MKVSIPAVNDIEYYQDHKYVKLYGGVGEGFGIYRFDQLDIEAYLKVLDGQWRRV